MSGKSFASSPVEDEVPVISDVAARPGDSDAEADEGPLFSVGEQLRGAREAKGMTVADVAKVLKLSVHQVVALEENNWSQLPGNTIIRGFVRNYARLFKLDAEPLMHALSALQVPQATKLDVPVGQPNIPLPQTGRVERRDFAAVVSGFLLLVLAVLAYFFMPQDFWAAKLVALMDEITAPEAFIEKIDKTPSAALPVPLAPAVGDARTAAEPAVPPTLPAAGAVANGAAPQQGAASDAGSGLRLSFTQPSWVEIRDRSGQIIFSQLNPAGSQRDIEGQPPFALVIGNASNVTVHYKGQLVELSQRSKDDVARLNLD